MNISEARRLLKRAQKLVTIPEFTVTIEMGNLNRNTLADVDIDMSERTAKIRLSEKRKDEVTEKVILHELVHILIYRLWQYVEVLLEKGFKDPLSRKTLETEYEVIEEEIVNRICDSLLRRRVTRRSRRLH